MFFFDASQFDCEFSTTALHACKKKYMWQDHALLGLCLELLMAIYPAETTATSGLGSKFFRSCCVPRGEMLLSGHGSQIQTKQWWVAWLGKDVVKPTIDNNMSKTNAETLWPSIISYKEVWHNITVGVVRWRHRDFRNIFGIFAEGERSSRKPRKEKSTGDLTKGVSFVRGSTLQPTSVPARCLVSKVVKLKDVMTNSMFHNPIMFQKVLESLETLADAIWSDFIPSDCWTWTHQTRHRQRKRRKKRKRRMTKMKIPMSIVDLSWMPVYPMAISSQQWRDLNFLLATSCPLTKCQVAMERVLLCCRRWASLVEVLENTMMALPIPSKYRNDRVKELYKMMGRWLTKIFMEMKVGVFRNSHFLGSYLDISWYFEAIHPWNS